jgi:hypothetical protein
MIYLRKLGKLKEEHLTFIKLVMNKKPRDEMTPEEKRSEHAEVRKFLQDKTGHPEGRDDGGGGFIELVKRAIRPNKK